MKLITVITLMLLSFKTLAYSGTQILDYTIAEIIYATALPTATSDVTVNITSTQAQKQQAKQIQNEIQTFLASDEIGLLLENKINFIKSFDPNISLNECIDILSEATQIILCK